MIRDKIIIWGAGEFGKNTVQCFTSDLTSLEILAVVDKDSNKWGQNLFGFPIISYEEMIEMPYDRILICSPKFQNEIYTFLLCECGISEQKIEIVEDCGYFIYKRIEEKYKYIDINTIKDLQKRQVVQYLKCHDARMFCYDFVEKYRHNKPEIFWDSEENLNYILHEEKKMYMSPKLQGEESIRQYYNSLCMEQDVQSPHLYQSNMVHVKEGDVLLDVGAAEGFFALSVIDKISCAYLIEADSEWEHALKATFKPYQNKVKIISKYASDRVEGNETTIDSIIKGQRVDFIKMDIEGAERKALAGAVNTLKTHSVRCSICTYHNDEDFTEISSFFDNLNYRYETAEGYILCGGMWEKDNREIDFRKGVLRSWKE